MLERKRAERQVGSVAAAQSIVQVLFIRKFSRNKKIEETGAVRDGGAKMGFCFAFLTITWNKTLVSQPEPDYS